MKIGLRINGVDVKTQYGMSLSSGALAALMTPPPAKDRVTNKSRLEHGARVISAQGTEKIDERQLSLPVHFVANSEVQFVERYNRFCAMLAGGVLQIELTLPSGKIMSYLTYYQSCTQYSHYFGGIAKFILKVTEPNPYNASNNPYLPK